MYGELKPFKPRFVAHVRHLGAEKRLQALDATFGGTGV